MLTDLPCPKANFSKAELSDAKLCGATLTETSFVEAVVRNADFTKADLSGAVLQGADLTAADLSGADLTGTKFAGALFNDPVQATNANVSAFPMGNRSSVQTGSIVFAAGFILRVSGDHPASADHTYYRSSAGSWNAGTKQGHFTKNEIRLLS